MKPIYIFRHLEHEGPGYFADFLEQRHIPYTVIRIDQGDAVPESIEHASALVFMGGNMSVNDPLPWIDQELALIRQAAAVNMPVLGHCLGSQLISKALGGSITANPVKEIGWLDVEQMDNAVARTWCERLPKRLLMFHWHGETFTLPGGAAHILKSQHCANQGFVINNMLGLQCHVEMTANMVVEWARESPHELANPSHTVQNAEQMTEQLQTRIAELHQIADVLYSRWLLALKN